MPDLWLRRCDFRNTYKWQGRFFLAGPKGQGFATSISTNIGFVPDTILDEWNSQYSAPEIKAQPVRELSEAWGAWVAFMMCHRVPILGWRRSAQKRICAKKTTNSSMVKMNIFPSILPHTDYSPLFSPTYWARSTILIILRAFSGLESIAMRSEQGVHRIRKIV